MRQMTRQEQNEIFSQWLEAHRGIFFKIIRAYAFNLPDQEDLFQEISVQVWRSVLGFKGDSAVATWIYRIALNTALKWSSKERKHSDQEKKQEWGEHILSLQQEKPDERLEWLYEQLTKLDKIDRSVCLLLLDGFSYKEMAIMVGISESYVGVRINRIKKHLTQQSEKLKNGV